MTRHSLHMIALALGGAAVLATAAAQAQTSGSDVDCATFLAMDEGQMNAMAAVVEGELAQGQQPPAVDDAALREAGIDPAAMIETPPPAPGETARVLKEACAAAADATLVDALSAPQPETGKPSDG